MLDGPAQVIGDRRASHPGKVQVVGVRCPSLFILRKQRCESFFDGDDALPVPFRRPLHALRHQAALAVPHGHVEGLGPDADLGRVAVHVLGGERAEFADAEPGVVEGVEDVRVLPVALLLRFGESCEFVVRENPHLLVPVALRGESFDMLVVRDVLLDPGASLAPVEEGAEDAELVIHGALVRVSDACQLVVLQGADVDVVARKFGVDRKTVVALIAQGLLDVYAYSPGTYRKALVSKASFRRFLQRTSVRPVDGVLR